MRVNTGVNRFILLFYGGYRDQDSGCLGSSLELISRTKIKCIQGKVVSVFN
jgi:hypothetical protein